MSKFGLTGGPGLISLRPDSRCSRATFGDNGTPTIFESAGLGPPGGDHFLRFALVSGRTASHTQTQWWRCGSVTRGWTMGWTGTGVSFRMRHHVEFQEFGSQARTVGVPMDLVNGTDSLAAFKALLEGTVWAGYSYLDGLFAGEEAHCAAATDSSGGSQPAVTLTYSTITRIAGEWPDIAIEITTGGARGTAFFRWTANASDITPTWVSGVQTAASVALTGTGLSALFPVGTYTLGNVYLGQAWTYPADLGAGEGDSVLRIPGSDAQTEAALIAGWGSDGATGLAQFPDHDAMWQYVKRMRAAASAGDHVFRAALARESYEGVEFAHIASDCSFAGTWPAVRGAYDLTQNVGSDPVIVDRGSEELAVPPFPAPVLFLSTTGAVSLDNATPGVLPVTFTDDTHVTKVRFLVDGVNVGEATSAPWEVTWSGGSNGAHTVVARAYYDDSRSTIDSNSVTVHVLAAVDPPTSLGADFRFFFFSGSGVTQSAGRCSAWAAVAGSVADRTASGSNRAFVVTDTESGLQILRGDGVVTTGVCMQGTNPFTGVPSLAVPQYVAITRKSNQNSNGRAVFAGTSSRPCLLQVTSSNGNVSMQNGLAGPTTTGILVDQWRTVTCLFTGSTGGANTDRISSALHGGVANDVYGDAGNGGGSGAGANFAFHARPTNALQANEDICAALGAACDPTALQLRQYGAYLTTLNVPLMWQA